MFLEVYIRYVSRICRDEINFQADVFNATSQVLDLGRLTLISHQDENPCKKLFTSDAVPNKRNLHVCTRGENVNSEEL